MRNKPTLVIQYEGKRGAKPYIAHLAVMEPGAISGFSYPVWEKHEQVAHYLCTTSTPAYTGWDDLTAERLADHAGQLCPKCFGGPFDGISTT